MSKIIFVTPGLAKGGAETQLVRLARSLAKAEHKVLIVSLKQIYDFPGDLRDDGIEVVFLESNWLKNFFKNVRILLSTFKEFKPRVVIAFMFIAILVARLLKIFMGFKLVSTIRASRIDRKWRSLFKLTSSFDDVVIYNSATSKQFFESSELAKKDGTVINNAISVPKAVSESSRRDRFTWISIAHFRIDKDYVTLFKAIALLKGRNFSVVIVGHLYDLNWPSEMVSQLGIENHVHLMGFQPNVGDLLEKSDGLILSSFSEGMPNAILEAMAFAKPIVASDIDSNIDIVGNSMSGYLFKTGDPENLALKMISMMDLGYDERLEMGMNGRNYIIDNFEESLIFNQWLSILQPFLQRTADKSVGA